MQRFAELAREQAFLATGLRHQRGQRAARRIAAGDDRALDSDRRNRLRGREVGRLVLARRTIEAACAGVLEVERLGLDHPAVDTLVVHGHRLGMGGLEPRPQREPARQAVSARRVSNAARRRQRRGQQRRQRCGAAAALHGIPGSSFHRGRQFSRPASGSERIHRPERREEHHQRQHRQLARCGPTRRAEDAQGLQVREVDAGDVARHDERHLRVPDEVGVDHHRR